MPSRPRALGWRDVTSFAVRFCRALRERGLLATPAESVDALRTLSAVDLGDRADVYFALRALLSSRREDLAIFDELFEKWWRLERGGSAREGTESTRRNPAAHSPTDESRTTRGSEFLRHWGSWNEETQEEEALSMATPSENDARAAADFSTHVGTELGAIEAAAAHIARRLRARPGRRWKPMRRGEHIDLRRLVRLSLRTGGDPIELAYRTRKLRRTKLVVLCDVSGSMDLYSRFLLQFLFALQHAFARVETFAFSTRLVHITESLRRDSYRSALDALATLPGWSGGTKIGDSLDHFLAGWPRLLDRRTIVIVLSDGWDTGEPEVLSESLKAMRRRAGRVVWLNPLLGSPSYQPLARGMQAALPHVDVFAPLHDVASLEALARHLSL
jgi:uncharacterized protein with von Willebrand factor type A (vWA) domain